MLRRRREWPARTRPGTGRVAAVTVSYGTRDLTAQLIFSLHRVLARGALAEIVVVDNGSRDGSVELLRGLESAGLITLIANRRQRYHGPALSQAFSHLARHQDELELDLVWVLDSDVVVLREETLNDAREAIGEAAMLGQDEGAGPLPLNCLLTDPARVWRRELPPFEHAGDPAERLQRALAKRGETLAPFPFRHGSYVLHLGRGSLRGLVEREERANDLYGWAGEHHDAHFGGHPFGRELHAAFLARYRAEVGADTADTETLARVCAREERVTVPGARPLPPVPELLAMREAGTLDDWVASGRARLASP